MTDTSLPVKAINAHDYTRGALPTPHITSLHQRPFAADSTQEDDGQISCICGYADDDGYTVACDLCNRWQHQLCYYPQYDDGGLPQDLQHYCIECRYRPIDKERARTRQREHREKREHAESLTNGVKRAVSKSHKKKIKEPGAQTNGWPAVDKIRHDRNSASPRDVAPPAKRPKTSHRASDSTTTTLATNGTTTTIPTAKGHSRKRNTSTVNHRRSASRPPEINVDQYSTEFLRCYQEDQWDVTGANLHNSISVTNALSEWVDLPEDEFRAMHGQAKGDLLNRWDGDLEDIPGRACVAIESRQDETVLYGGQHPSWKFLTVEDPVPNGAYIGELKGRIDFKKEYQEETKNRWSRLRHPEPFVFFHPSLPIVIDAREEGTELRYVRRSCRPNARLQILVTNHVDYHFCFMATQQIDPGMEIAMGWDTNDGLPELTNRNNILEGDMELLSDWVSTALANCGPCACQQPEEDCMMSRFDRRIRGHESEVQPAKTVKSKKRKANNQISPLNTNSVNSRSGSEVRKVEPDDEGTESRSVSGSAGRGSASRDITPNTHYSTNGGQSGMIPEVSERERKKMAKEEEIFRRQEEERNGKRGKTVKRSSAGSNLNTPSATSSKQLGFPTSASSKNMDSAPSKQVSTPATKGGPGRKPKVQKPLVRSANRVNNRPKPVYVDANTQCDLDAEEASHLASLRPPRSPPKKRYISSRQRLLDRCARNNAQRRRDPNLSLSTEQSVAGLRGDSVDMAVCADSPSALSSHSVPKSSADVSRGHGHVPPSDMDMQDAPTQDIAKSEAGVEGSASVSSPQELSARTEVVGPASPDDPHVPSIAPASIASSSDADPLEVPPASTAMHVEMPPPLASTTSVVAGPVAQSPAALGSGTVFSPAVTAAVSPSPARKKLSLSDYTRRSKAKDHDGKADRESSPASTASGPVMHHSSSTNGGPAIDEDVKMEDVENISPQA